jgi:predicted nucleic acid-binding protein
MRLILADTGVVSRRLTKNQPIIDAFEYIGKERIVVSSITKIELFNWVNGYKSQLGEKVHRELVAEINKFPVIQIDRKVSSVAIELSKYYLTKVPDLLIASTALHHGIEIFTVNAKDFKNIKGVDLYNPPNYSEIKKTL